MLPFLTLAFIGGLFLGSLIPYYPVSISVFLCLLAAGFSLLEAKGYIAAVAATASFACVLCGVLYWFEAVEGRSKAGFHEPLPEVFQSCSGRVIAPVQYSPDRMLMVVRCDAEEGSRSVVVRLTWRAADRRIYQGDRISLRAKLRAPTSSVNPGAFDYAAHLEQLGVDAVATVNGIEAVEVVESGNESLRWCVWNRVDRWR